MRDKEVKLSKEEAADLRAVGRALGVDYVLEGTVRTETGRVRWYATAMAAGSVLFIAMVLFV